MLKHINVKKNICLVCLLGSFLVFSLPSYADDSIDQMTSMVNLMDNFYDLMDSIYEMNSDSEKAALLQMHEIAEIYKERGQPEKAVDVYKDVLQKSKNPTVRNIAYHRMADVLKESGQLDQAVNVLNEALNETLRQTK